MPSDVNGPRLPLAGLVVIDFGQISQGPYATLLLAKGGADVIKIEPPQGEPLRRRARPGTSSTLPFAMLNQNKRAVTLNLKHPRGRELLFEMVRRADVLLENFSPGTMDALGVGWQVLREINPRLIYATGTGFGISGPDRDNLAMDLTIQAASGIMSVTGAPDGPPMKAGPTLVDYMGGIHLYAAILTALRRRSIPRSPPASNITTAPVSRRRAPATARPGCRARPTMSIPAPMVMSRSMSSPKAIGRTC
jgi:CoA:oxalate CoA-transferase